MSKITHQFGFVTRYFNSYRKKDLGELVIIGKGYLHTNNFEKLESDNDPESLFSYDIEKVLLNGKDLTDEYRADDVLSDDLLTVIVKSTLGHIEWLFRAEVAEHYQYEIDQEHEQDATDICQDEFPTDDELQKAINVIRASSNVNKAA